MTYCVKVMSKVVVQSSRHWRALLWSLFGKVTTVFFGVSIVPMLSSFLRWNRGYMCRLRWRGLYMRMMYRWTAFIATLRWLSQRANQHHPYFVLARWQI